MKTFKATLATVAAVALSTAALASTTAFAQEAPAKIHLLRAAKSMTFQPVRSQGPVKMFTWTKAKIW